MENVFGKLSAINVNKKLAEKDGLKYLSWADAWTELKKIDPTANYKVYENAEGLPYFESALGIMVKVGVTQGGLEHVVLLPVMNGANKAMKSQGYTYEVNDYQWNNQTRKKELVGKKTKEVEAADMMAINKTIQRALTKAIAMHGLGLYIYAGEDMPEDTETPKTAPVQKESPKPESYTPQEENAPVELITPNQLFALGKKLEENKLIEKVTEDLTKRLSTLNKREASAYIGGKKDLKQLITI